MDLKNIKTFVFNLDGTIRYWTRLIAGVKRTISKLKKLGNAVIYVTNNPIESRKSLAKRFSDFGIKTRYDDVIHAGIVIGYYIKGHDGTALGKPSNYTAKIVSKRLGNYKRTAYVGDEYKSDIMFGKKLECYTIFVNAGMDKNKKGKIKRISG